MNISHTIFLDYFVNRIQTRHIKICDEMFIFTTMKKKNLNFRWNKNPQQNQNIALKPVELNKKSKKKKCC